MKLRHKPLWILVGALGVAMTAGLAILGAVAGARGVSRASIPSGSLIESRTGDADYADSYAAEVPDSLFADARTLDRYAFQRCTVAGETKEEIMYRGESPGLVYHVSYLRRPDGPVTKLFVSTTVHFKHVGGWLYFACVRPGHRVLTPFMVSVMIRQARAGEDPSLPPASFAFGVFGDGPYRWWEVGRFRQVLRDVNREDLQWFLHVGDLFWYPCSDKAYADQFETLNSIRHPVVYTPGDNEWTDCYERVAGGYRPLERLQRLRAVFFPDPGRSLGGRPLRLETQSADTAFAEYVENARWVRGGFVFATLHMVGSANATEGFPGRGSADDREVIRRTEAALAWMEDAFRLARSDSLFGVVLALHAELELERDPVARPGYESFVDRLEDLVKAFDGQVLLIHGDSHKYRVDHPLRDRMTGEPIPNLTRLETFGSPDIGWVRVVVDSAAGRIVAYEPHLMSRWRLW